MPFRGGKERGTPTLEREFWNEYFADYEFIDDDNELAREYVQSWAGRLMVFVLAGYMFHLVTAYWIGTRLKCAQLLIGTSKVVDVLTTTIDYDNPHAEEFLRDLWGAIHLIGHYAFKNCSSLTNYTLSEHSNITSLSGKSFIMFSISL